MKEEIVKCPYCDCDNVHIERVEINRNGELTKITNEGTSLRAGCPDGRGASIAVTFWCEWGHKWTRRFHFQKGTTSITDELLISSSIEHMDSYISDLWRD